MGREQKVKKGDVVEWEDQTCRVLRRRPVTGMAMFSTCEYEVYLETLEGEQVGWIGVMFRGMWALNFWARWQVS